MSPSCRGRLCRARVSLDSVARPSKPRGPRWDFWRTRLFLVFALLGIVTVRAKAHSRVPSWWSSLPSPTRVMSRAMSGREGSGWAQRIRKEDRRGGSAGGSSRASCTSSVARLIGMVNEHRADDGRAAAAGETSSLNGADVVPKQPRPSVGVGFSAAHVAPVINAAANVPQGNRSGGDHRPPLTADSLKRLPAADKLVAGAPILGLRQQNGGGRPPSSSHARSAAAARRKRRLRGGARRRRRARAGRRRRGSPPA